MFKDKQPDIPRFSSKEEIETCQCCGVELTDEEDYDTYGGLCEGCWQVRPAFNEEGGEDFSNGCDYYK